MTSETRLQDAQNPNLIWITEASGGQLKTRTEETTEAVTNSTTQQVNENEFVITQTIVRTKTIKHLVTINNTTQNP